MPSLTEGEDFYYNEQGFMVLTARYLLNRGFCCGNGCRHCPYNYEAVPEPRRSELLAQRKPNVTFLTHDKYFLEKMDGLSLGRWLFFSVWITEYLYRQFGQQLRPRFEEEEELDLAEVLAFLWDAVEIANANGHELLSDAALARNEEQISGYLAGLENDDIYDDLDQTDTRGIGQAVLISAFYNALKFIQTRDTRLIAAQAFFPLDVIDCMLTNEMNLSAQDSTIRHPLHQAELATQDRLIAYLQSGAPVGEEQKDLYRTA